MFRRKLNLYYTNNVFAITYNSNDHDIVGLHESIEFQGLVKDGLNVFLIVPLKYKKLENADITDILERG